MEKEVEAGNKTAQDGKKLKFSRRRGIVWVCDIVESSKHLNSDTSVADFETFLQRMYWLAPLVVEAAGGRFIKWTGDGFLAWFEIALHRQLGQTASAVFKAARDLTIMVNVSQLALSPQKKVRIRHGIAYEQDALMVSAHEKGRPPTTDLIGRNVVFAFRLSSITTTYPNIATQCDLVSAVSETKTFRGHFAKLRLGKEDKLKFFKGEDRGTRMICVSTDVKRKVKNVVGAIKFAKAAIALAESQTPPEESQPDYDGRLIKTLLEGPQWSKDIVNSLTRIREELLLSVKHMVSHLSTDTPGQ